MPESQIEEYKESWSEKHLKQICSFANTQGGKLYIGIDDHENIIGVKDHKKLMEDIPNIIRDKMGITSDLTLHKSLGKYYIEIVTPTYDVAISLNGHYYIRTGSTTLELKGNSLTEFLLRKSGLSWDDVIEPRANLSDIDSESVKEYLAAANNTTRLPDSKDLSIAELLEKLRLADGSKIKRSAIILFGKDPSRFYPNLSVKIGKFGGKDDDLISHEVIEGNLVKLLKNTVNVLLNKFVIQLISFEGFQRIEKNQYPVDALREMLLNALVHRSYLGSMTQIRVYDNRITIWNDGELPSGISLETLKRIHPSKPRNPIIAEVCFKGGYIDSWGRGTLKIINVCKEAGLPEPLLEEIDGGFMVTIFNNIGITVNPTTLMAKNAIDGAAKGAIEGAVKGAIEGAAKSAIEGAANQFNNIINQIFTNKTTQVKSKLSSLLEVISSNEGKKIGDYKDLTSIKAKTLEGYVAQLKEAELIEFIGKATQTGGYYLTDKFKEDLIKQIKDN